jgi:hypothetical protein
MIFSKKTKRQNTEVMKAKRILLSMVAMVLMLGNIMAEEADKSDKNKNETNISAAPVNAAISGVIVDEITGEALTGVEVKLNGSESKTYTDFEGKFVFDIQKPGKYSVETNFISYQSVKQAINVDQNEVHALNLKLGVVND